MFGCAGVHDRLLRRALGPLCRCGAASGLLYTPLRTLLDAAGSSLSADHVAAAVRGALEEAGTQAAAGRGARGSPR